MGLAALVTALVLHMHAVPAQHHSTRPVWPASGTITSPFGRDGARYHPGIDIGILRTLAVRAATAGRVELVGRPLGYEGYGNVVVVRSGGLEEVYGHLASERVHRGQLLWSGERIATAGCTGWCTGTHLHFEVRRHGTAVSPLATVLRPLVAPQVRHLRPQRLRLLASAVVHKPLG